MTNHELVASKSHSSEETFVHIFHQSKEVIWLLQSLKGWRCIVLSQGGAQQVLWPSLASVGQGSKGAANLWNNNNLLQCPCHDRGYKGTA